jgi:hypothetical protein
VIKFTVGKATMDAMSQLRRQLHEHTAYLRKEVSFFERLFEKWLCEVGSLGGFVLLSLCLFLRTFFFPWDLAYFIGLVLLGGINWILDTTQKIIEDMLWVFHIERLNLDKKHTEAKKFSGKISRFSIEANGI